MGSWHSFKYCHYKLTTRRGHRQLKIQPTKPIFNKIHDNTLAQKVEKHLHFWLERTVFQMFLIWLFNYQIKEQEQWKYDSWRVNCIRKREIHHPSTSLQINISNSSVRQKLLTVCYVAVLNVVHCMFASFTHMHSYQNSALWKSCCLHAVSGSQAAAALLCRRIYGNVRQLLCRRCSPD